MVINREENERGGLPFNSSGLYENTTPPSQFMSDSKRKPKQLLFDGDLVTDKGNTEEYSGEALRIQSPQHPQNNYQLHGVVARMLARPCPGRLVLCWTMWVRSALESYRLMSTARHIPVFHVHYHRHRQSTIKRLISLKATRLKMGAYFQGRDTSGG